MLPVNEKKYLKTDGRSDRTENRGTNIPRIVIGAPQGRSGKTTVTLGIISALISRGVVVQSFKKGPDFIDPSWMTKLTGRPCRNLDTFLMSKEDIKKSFFTHAREADVGIVEGAMGLYDGVDIDGSGSTAEVAKTISAPVVLVVNCTRITRSVGAMVLGYLKFDPDVNIGGIILNRVARSRHENMLRASIERYCGIPVIGALPKGKVFTIPDRHLGLIPAGERENLFQAVEELGHAAGKYIDLDRLLEIASSAGPLPEKQERPFEGARLSSIFPKTGAGTKTGCQEKPVIGIIRDRAFSFYYPENLEALESAGGELVFINALRDKSLIPVDGLYIGGGFPEVFARELQKNVGFRDALRTEIERGLPVYAECGGLMFLGRKIFWRGRACEMVKALPFEVEMLEKPQGHGYVAGEIIADNPFFEKGTSIRAHEFHHSRVVNLQEEKVNFAYRLHRGWGIDGERDGMVYKNVLAAYSHVHALTTTRWAESLVQKALAYRRYRQSQ